MWYLIVSIPDLCNLTYFETPKGLFQFKSMPFSFVNAGGSFCRLIRIVLQGLRNVDSFVDNMWIFTKTWKKHLKSIQATLDRLRAAKLTAKPSKCKIGYNKIECLGHKYPRPNIKAQR